MHTPRRDCSGDRTRCAPCSNLVHRRAKQSNSTTGSRCSRGGARTALPRHQTLRSLIDWSHDLLSEADKTMLRRCSVFVGGCTIETAQVVCAGDGIAESEILDRLTSLTDKSLLVAETTGRHHALQDARDGALLRARPSSAVWGGGGCWFATCPMSFGPVKRARTERERRRSSGGARPTRRRTGQHPRGVCHVRARRCDFLAGASAGHLSVLVLANARTSG